MSFMSVSGCLLIKLGLCVAVRKDAKSTVINSCGRLIPGMWRKKFPVLGRRIKFAVEATDKRNVFVVRAHDRRRRARNALIFPECIDNERVELGACPSGQRDILLKNNQRSFRVMWLAANFSSLSLSLPLSSFRRRRPAGRQSNNSAQTPASSSDQRCFYLCLSLSRSNNARARSLVPCRPLSLYQRRRRRRGGGEHFNNSLPLPPSFLTSST